MRHVIGSQQGTSCFNKFHFLWFLATVLNKERLQFTDILQLNERTQIWLNENFNLFQYYLEAAELFECSGNKDQAAVLFARLKNWNQVSRLIHDVTQPKVHIAYAKVRLICSY